MLNNETVSAYLKGLQNRITSAIAEIDGGEFLVDPWQKPAGEMPASKIKSNQRRKENGSPGRIRTYDRSINSRLLYH